MRQQIDDDIKCKTRGLSLPPKLERYASKKAFTAGISFSKYIQLLIDLDIQKGVLAATVQQTQNAGVKREEI
jgi:hypothetical protein